jgi:hypothetical protein
MILVSLFLPALNHPRITAKKVLAEAEEINLLAAINQYYSDYGRFPISSNAYAAAGTNDFTFGTIRKTPVANGRISLVTVETPGESAYQNDNSEVMAILTDSDRWPESSGSAAHIYNTNDNVYFSPRLASDTSSPGLGTDGVLRDPWGNPYIITVDLTGDNQCYDATLARAWHLRHPGDARPYSVPGSVVVWSFGQSKTLDLRDSEGAKIKQNTIVSSAD